MNYGDSALNRNIAVNRSRATLRAPQLYSCHPPLVATRVPFLGGGSHESIKPWDYGDYGAFNRNIAVNRSRATLSALSP
jgi:hypothetical protein